MGKKVKVKKISAKKEKYARFAQGIDDRIASRHRVTEIEVSQEFRNENDQHISAQMRRHVRDVPKKKK